MFRCNLCNVDYDDGETCACPPVVRATGGVIDPDRLRAQNRRVLDNAFTFEELARLEKLTPNQIRARLGYPPLDAGHTVTINVGAPKVEYEADNVLRVPYRCQCGKCDSCLGPPIRGDDGQRKQAASSATPGRITYAVDDFTSIARGLRSLERDR